MTRRVSHENVLKLMHPFILELKNQMPRRGFKSVSKENGPKLKNIAGLKPGCFALNLWFPWTV